MTSNTTSEEKFPGVALQDLDIVKQYLSVHEKKQLQVLVFFTLMLKMSQKFAWKKNSVLEVVFALVSQQ